MLNNQGTFFTRNAGFTARNPRKAWATRKAMNAYRKAHPACAYCGRSGAIHVHHVEPVSVAPERAADPANFISLCGKRCHITVGHGGNYRHHVVSVRALCLVVEIDRR